MLTLEAEKYMGNIQLKINSQTYIIKMCILDAESCVTQCARPHVAHSGREILENVIGQGK